MKNKEAYMIIRISLRWNGSRALGLTGALLRWLAPPQPTSPVHLTASTIPNLTNTHPPFALTHNTPNSNQHQHQTTKNTTKQLPFHQSQTKTIKFTQNSTRTRLFQNPTPKSPKSVVPTSQTHILRWSNKQSKIKRNQIIQHQSLHLKKKKKRI